MNGSGELRAQWDGTLLFILSSLYRIVVWLKLAHVIEGSADGNREALRPDPGSRREGTSRTPGVAPDLDSRITRDGDCGPRKARAGGTTGTHNRHG